MSTRLVPNSDERTNLSPEERRQARKRSYRLLREILRPHRLSLAISVAAGKLGADPSAAHADRSPLQHCRLHGHL